MEILLTSVNDFNFLQPRDDPKDIEAYVEKLLREAQKTVWPRVLREREAEKIGQDIYKFRMDTAKG